MANPSARAEQPAEQLRELSDELLAALAALAPEQRALVVLRHLLGYRASDLARMLDMPPATVRTQLARALARLRVVIEGEGEKAS